MTDFLSENYLCSPCAASKPHQLSDSCQSTTANTQPIIRGLQLQKYMFFYFFLFYNNTSLRYVLTMHVRCIIQIYYYHLYYQCPLLTLKLPASGSGMNSPSVSEESRDVLRCMCFEARGSVPGGGEYRGGSCDTP